MQLCCFVVVGGGNVGGGVGGGGVVVFGVSILCTVINHGSIVVECFLHSQAS